MPRDPVALLVARVGQVDPDRQRALKIGTRFDIDLAEPPVLQHEYIDHQLSRPQVCGMPAAHTHADINSLHFRERGL